MLSIINEVDPLIFSAAYVLYAIQTCIFPTPTVPQAWRDREQREGSVQRGRLYSQLGIEGHTSQVEEGDPSSRGGRESEDQPDDRAELTGLRD